LLRKIQICGRRRPSNTTERQVSNELVVTTKLLLKHKGVHGTRRPDSHGIIPNVYT
jgi:hypothetical protein